MSKQQNFQAVRLASALACLLSVSLQVISPSSARAGGYDIPLVNTARYGGQGGTGIAFVDGGTSLYLNPAGLGRIGKANVDLAATILAGRVRGTPTFLTPDVNVETPRGQPLVFPFVSAAGRLTDFLAIGVAAYIVGGAGGEYVYKLNPNAEEPIDDKTELVFQESTIGIAFNIDKIGLNIGAGYRITFARLVRTRPDPITNINFTLKGVNFEGFRVGFQWQPNEHFAIGAVYRNKVTVNASANSGTALNTEFTSIETPLILPARTGGGVRFDWGPFGTAIEFEWIFNSQNDVITLTTEPALPVEVQNVFDWSDQYLIRWGGEYGFFEGQWPVRLGFVFGSTTTSAQFPNAFGPPPAPEYVITVGTGYNHEPWQLSFAYARAFSSTFVDVDTSDFLTECPNCGGPGEYALTANHFIFDFSYNWR